jgi:hypothetical protein
VWVGDRGGVRLRGAGALLGVYLVSADSLLKLTTQIRRISSDGGFAEFFVVGADRKKCLSAIEQGLGSHGWLALSRRLARVFGLTRSGRRIAEER